MSLPTGKPVKAKKIANSLYAAFPGANPPVVWKFDLEKNHSFTMALQGEDGDWELGVTSPRGEFNQVARFMAREDADDAFACAQKALLKKDRNLWRILGPLCAILIVLFILFNIIQIVIVHFGSDQGFIPPAQSSATQGMTAPVQMPAYKIKEGIPLPADQVLTAPQ